MDLAWLSLIALIAVVVISCASRVNPGVVAIALAWMLVLGFGKQSESGFTVKSLWSNFPAELFLTLLGVSLLFAQAEVNGTLARVASGAQRLCRGNRGLIPVMFFLFAFGLGSAGPGNIAVAGLLAPVAMAAASRLQISPLLMALMVGHGAIASTVSPLTAAGATANTILEGMELRGHQAEVFGYNAAANALAAVLAFLLFGGWRLLWEKSAERSTDVEGAREFHCPLTWRHWLTMVVVAALVVAVVGYDVPIGLGAFFGGVILAGLQAADERETFLKIPWGVIVMVCGVSLLTVVLDKTGGTKLFASGIQKIVTPATACPLVAVTTGIVSVYSSTTGVVLPAFLPMVKELARGETGVPPLSLALSVLVGGNLVDMSPLSTIGALCLAGHPGIASRKRLFNELLVWGVAMAFFGAGLCWLWFGISWR
jgi:di/tricarboxylate transporter